jgi:peptidoglycan/xylan/chitin deacetylase (PgdA/CDA1 family)
MTALILTYHAVEEGPPPLCMPPDRFRSQLDALGDLAVTTVTVSALVQALWKGVLPECAVAITFDDGCASAARSAAPLLVERGMTATFFAVAGYLGGWNDWPSQPAAAPRLELAAAGELRELADLGFEIGAHGTDHAPLDEANGEVARLELEQSKQRIEEITGRGVRSFAYPYGILPSSTAASLAAELYDAACGLGSARVTAGSDPLALPRVDAHYLRRPWVLRRVAGGGWDSYLRLREVGGYSRRILGSAHRPLKTRS